VITKAIAMANIVGLVVLDFVRGIPKAVHAAFMVLALMTVGQSAQAAPVSPAAADDLGSFLGCPTLSWAAPLQGTSQNITGMVFGFVVIAALVVMLISGVRLLFANNRSDRASGAIEGVKNAGIGAAVVLIGLPVAALVIWGLAIAFNPACR